MEADLVVATKAKARPQVPVTPQRVIALRTATGRDVSALYHCLIRYFDECKLYYPPPVESDVMLWGLVIIGQGRTVVAECDGKIIGSVGLELGTFPWNHAQHYLNSVWLFVEPEFRKGYTGIKLIRAAQQIAARSGLPLRMDEVWAYEIDRLATLKQRLGFHRIGGSFAWIPNDPNRDEAEV